MAQPELQRLIGRILTSGDYQRMPWKNGGGVTMEIHKAVSPASEMLWRLSIAEVASDGPFSEFPGIDRWIMVIEGTGMDLTVDGATHTVDKPYEPLFFSGDAKTDCKLLNGNIRDFNFMIARSYGKGALQVLRLEAGMSAPLNTATVAVHVLEGRVDLETSEVRELETRDTWIADDPGKVKLKADGTAIAAILSIEVPDAH